MGSKFGSQWVPNRIIDAEGVKKPLDRHLGGYDSALGAILGALRRQKRVLGTPARQHPRDPSQRGGVGEGINPSPQGLEEKRDWLRRGISSKLYTPRGTEASADLAGVICTQLEPIRLDLQTLG